MSRRELANYAIEQLLAGASSHSLAKQLAASLLANGRAKEAEFLIADIFAELEARGNLAKVTITTANRLSTELAKLLAGYARAAVGARAVLSKQVVEPNLLGGFRLETAHRAWDKTIARELAELRGTN